MQDGENPAAMGAASGAAPSQGQSNRPKIGINFDPANIFGASAKAPVSAPATEAQSSDNAVIVEQTVETVAIAETSVPIEESAPVESVAEPAVTNAIEESVDFQVSEPTPIGTPENPVSEQPEAGELEAEIETESLETPILDNIPINEKGPELLNSTRPAAPAKRSVGPAIIVFICIIGILVVGIVILIAMGVAKRAAPVVEEAVEAVEEKVEEETTGRHITLPKKKKAEDEEQTETSQEETPVETPEDTAIYINLDTPGVRIRMPETENYVNYRVIGDTVYFWAATKRDGVDFSAQTNCENNEQSAEQEENCAAEPSIPEFADRFSNTGGMAAVRFWLVEDSDYGQTVYNNGEYYFLYQPNMNGPYSRDEENGAWESESLAFLFDWLTDSANYEAIPAE